MYTIRIKWEKDPKSLIELPNVHPGQTLLEVFLKHGIEIQHECGGVCFCRTCHLVVEKGMTFFEEISKREKDFIARISNAQSNSRLACQCLLIDAQGEIEVSLPTVQ